MCILSPALWDKKIKILPLKSGAHFRNGNNQNSGCTGVPYHTPISLYLFLRRTVTLICLFFMWVYIYVFIFTGTSVQKEINIIKNNHLSLYQMLYQYVFLPAHNALSRYAILLKSPTCAGCGRYARHLLPFPSLEIDYV